MSAAQLEVARSLDLLRLLVRAAFETKSTDISHRVTSKAGENAHRAADMGGHEIDRPHPVGHTDRVDLARRNHRLMRCPDIISYYSGRQLSLVAAIKQRCCHESGSFCEPQFLRSGVRPRYLHSR